jgi:hypothetical protein
MKQQTRISEEDYGTVAVFEDLYGNLWNPIPGIIKNSYG